MYPNSFNITDNNDAYQRFILIRLPSWMGGENDSITSYRAYSAVGLSDHCMLYWPQQGRWRIEDLCSGDMYRAIDGYLYVKQGNPTLLQNNVGLPQLDLIVDKEGYIAVELPTFTQDKNGAIGIGRTLLKQKIDDTTEFMKRQQTLAQEITFNAPTRLTTGEYAQQVEGDWYAGSIGYQAEGGQLYYPLVKYQFCNCTNHDILLSQKAGKYSTMYKAGNSLILATTTAVSVNGTKYNYAFDFYRDPSQVKIVTLKPLDAGIRMILENF